MAVGRQHKLYGRVPKKYKTQSGYNKDNWVFTGSYQNEYCDFYRLTDSGNHSERHENSDVFNAYNDKAGSYVNGNRKVVVTENGETGNYYYFHWCRGRKLQGGPTNSSVCIGGQYQCRTGDKTVTFQSPHYHAFVGDGYVDKWSGNVCQKANWANCADSYWYYRIPIRRQTISSYETGPYMSITVYGLIQEKPAVGALQPRVKIPIHPQILLQDMI